MTQPSFDVCNVKLMSKMFPPIAIELNLNIGIKHKAIASYWSIIFNVQELAVTIILN